MVDFVDELGMGGSEKAVGEGDEACSMGVERIECGLSRCAKAGG